MIGVIAKLPPSPSAHKGNLYAYAKRNDKNGRHLLLTVCFYKRKKAEFCVCFDEACTASTQYTQRLPSSKISPFFAAVGGFSLRSKPMVCVTAVSLVTLFYIITGTFTHTQNEIIKTVGTCCLPFVFISG